MDILKRIFSRRWLLSTILVIIGVGVLARLGIWQLDRLEARRAFNARVQAQIDQPPLDLTSQDIQDDLANMEYREIQVVGEYDHNQQIALRNQYWDNQWGVHLVTPLRILGSDQYVMVDRGWIPAEDFQAGDWSTFNELGQVEVNGIIRQSRDQADFGSRSDPTPAPGAPPMKAWNFVNVGGLQQQLSYPLLPIYIQQSPDPAWSNLPHRSQPKLDLTEGPHMGYAIQWFTFAAILGLGYPFFIRRQEKRAAEEKHKKENSSQASQTSITAQVKPAESD